LEALHRSQSAMGGSIVDNPKHAPRIIIGRSSHDLFNEAVEGSNSAASFAAAKNFRAMNIESSQVSPGAATLVLMLDPHRPAGLANPSGMLTGSCLDTGLLVSRDHELIVLQRPAIPAALVEVQNAASFKRKVRVAREDPSSMLPRTDRVFVQPSPNRAAADLSDQARPRDVLSQVGSAPPRQWEIMSGGQFTGESFDLND